MHYFIYAFFVGLVIGAIFARRKLGCFILLVVPLAMMFQVSWWQAENPDALRSTSGLDFIFGPLWPSLGAILGFALGRWARAALGGK